MSFDLPSSPTHSRLPWMTFPTWFVAPLSPSPPFPLAESSSLTPSAQSQQRVPHRGAAASQSRLLQLHLRHHHLPGTRGGPGCGEFQQAANPPPAPRAAHDHPWPCSRRKRCPIPSLFPAFPGWVHQCSRAGRDPGATGVRQEVLPPLCKYLAWIAPNRVLCIPVIPGMELAGWDLSRELSNLMALSLISMGLG